LQLLLLGATLHHTCNGLHHCRNSCSSHSSSAGATFVACRTVTSFLACTPVDCCTHWIIQVDSIKTYLFYTLASAISTFNQSKLDCADSYPAPSPCQRVWFSQMLFSLCYLLLRDASHELVSLDLHCWYYQEVNVYSGGQHIIFKNLSRAHESHDHDEESSKDMVYCHVNAQALFCLCSIHPGGSLVVVIPDGPLMYNLCC
jgi:hypothetical protein